MKKRRIMLILVAVLMLSTLDICGSALGESRGYDIVLPDPSERYSITQQAMLIDTKKVEAFPEGCELFLYTYNGTKLADRTALKLDIIGYAMDLVKAGEYTCTEYDEEDGLRIHLKHVENNVDDIDVIGMLIENQGVPAFSLAVRHPCTFVNSDGGIVSVYDDEHFYIPDISRVLECVSAVVDEHFEYGDYMIYQYYFDDEECGYETVLDVYDSALAQTGQFEAAEKKIQEIEGEGTAILYTYYLKDRRLDQPAIYVMVSFHPHTVIMNIQVHSSIKVEGGIPANPEPAQ